MCGGGRKGDVDGWLLVWRLHNITCGTSSGLFTFILMLKSFRWVVVVHLDYNIRSGPFWTMNFEFYHALILITNHLPAAWSLCLSSCLCLNYNDDHGLRPGPELDNILTLL